MAPARPAADCRLRRLEDGRYEYRPKRGSSFGLSAPALVKRLVAVTPPPSAHLTTFHGVESAQRRLRPLVPRQPGAWASGFRRVREEFPRVRCLGVFAGARAQRGEGYQVLPYKRFLTELWTGSLVR